MGRIITFYSYKGGVGRTMALANIGLLLAQRKKRVLLVDFDLEAPGLLDYFIPKYLPDAAKQHPGVVELLTAAATRDPTVPFDWSEYVAEVTIKGSELAIMSSGAQTEAYASLLNAFEWPTFFAEQGGGRFLESFRREIRTAYDFVLIDSRTGITDTGGVCTIVLPDILVPVFVTNRQSVDGALKVVQRAQQGRRDLVYDRNRLLIYPLLSRFESRTEYREAQDWLKQLSRDLADLYTWVPPGVTPRHVLEQTKVPYLAICSFGETLPVLDGTTDPDSIGFAYAATASLMQADFADVETLLDPSKRSNPSDLHVVASAAQTVVDEMPEPDQHILAHLLVRFLPAPGPSEASGSATIESEPPAVGKDDLAPGERRLLDELLRVGVLVESPSSLRLSDSDLIPAWSWLQRVRADNEGLLTFLVVLRQRMSDSQQRLPRATLLEAEARLAEAPESFGSAARAYVDFSRRLRDVRDPMQRRLFWLRSAGVVALASGVSAAAAAAIARIFWGPYAYTSFAAAIAAYVVGTALAAALALARIRQRPVAIERPVGDTGVTRLAALQVATSLHHHILLDSERSIQLVVTSSSLTRWVLGQEEPREITVAFRTTSEGEQSVIVEGPRAAVARFVRRLDFLGVIGP